MLNNPSFYSLALGAFGGPPGPLEYGSLQRCDQRGKVLAAGEERPDRTDADARASGDETGAETEARPD